MQAAWKAVSAGLIPVRGGLSLLLVAVEVAGEPHTGSAELVAGLVIVTTAYGRRSTKIGDRDFILLARLMLGEIVREEKRKG